MANKIKSYFASEPITQVIGPQIGIVPETNTVKITIAFPNQAFRKLTCVLLDQENQIIDKIECKVLNEVFGHYIFEFHGLSSKEKYQYRFIDEEETEIDLEGGLTPNDCCFVIPDFNTQTDFVLLSCNNPFHSGQKEEAQFKMWELLRQQIKDDRSIALLIQGGDQLYNDDIEMECLKLLKDTPDDQSQVHQMIIKNYQHYYGNIDYRKIMASTPSVAMLDDHDITDGWGGRPESFDKDKNIKPEWQAFFDISYEAFKAYQTSKNPSIRLAEGTETTYIDFGKNRLYLMDLRKEKNIHNGTNPLLSKTHEENLTCSIRSLPDHIQSLFILSPVVPVRINPTTEEALGDFSRFLYECRGKAKIKMNSSEQWGWFWKCVYALSGVGGIADLTDDLVDGLASITNRPFLIRLLQEMAILQKAKGTKLVILSGDIHVGGVSEIFVRDGNQKTIISQIVSSPIGYEPMKKIAKDKTTEEIEYEIKIKAKNSSTEEDTVKITARNIFYRSDRNFAIYRNSETLTEDRVEFHFEGLSEPILSPVSFSK